MRVRVVVRKPLGQQKRSDVEGTDQTAHEWQFYARKGDESGVFHKSHGVEVVGARFDYLLFGQVVNPRGHPFGVASAQLIEGKLTVPGATHSKPGPQSEPARISRAAAERNFQMRLQNSVARGEDVKREPARSKHPPHLAESATVIKDVLHHVVAENEIEVAVRIGQSVIIKGNDGKEVLRGDGATGLGNSLAAIEHIASIR